MIAVRDTPVNDSNPFTTEDVIVNLETEYSEEVESGMVKIIPIPDIESVIMEEASVMKLMSLFRRRT